MLSLMVNIWWKSILKWLRNKFLKKYGFNMIFQIRPSNPPKKTELFSTCFYSKYHFLQYFLKMMTFYFIFSGIGGVRWCQMVFGGVRWWLVVKIPTQEGHCIHASVWKLENNSLLTHFVWLYDRPYYTYWGGCRGHDKKLTENFNMFWKTRIFDDSLTANWNKLRTYRNLKEKYETDTYLFLDIDKTLIKTIYANKN